MSIVAERAMAETIDMSGFEAQFDDGGNGGFDDIGQDFGNDGLPDKPKLDLVVCGGVAGFAGGIALGDYLMHKADGIMVANKTISTTLPTGLMGPIGGDYQPAINQYVEAGVFFVLVFALMSVGALIGRYLQDRRDQK